MSAIASALVAGRFSKIPRTALVTVWEPGFFTPRMDMHRCSASMTTITPAGSSDSTMVSAICDVSRSWTCGRLANTSTTRASFESPQIRPEAEVVGYRNVLAKIHASSDSFEINPETILQMHKEMLKGTNLPSGEWKRRDNTIEEKQSDGTWKTRFEPVTAVQTPYFMKTLCDEFNREWNKERADRIILILSFVLDFLCIHPFTDGNGRISRLLTVLLLHKSGYDVGRYISLEKLIEDSKETYYEILRDCSMGWHEGKHRILPWWRYSIGILISAYKEFMSRAGDVGSARGAKTDWIMEAIDNLGNSFTLAQIMKVCPGVSRPMIRVVVEKLRKKGVLKTLGTGRNAKWQKNVIISDKRDNKRDNKKKKPKK